MKRLGESVRGLRLRRGLTQVDLARLAGVSRQWLITLESGDKNRIEIGLVMRVLDELDASLLIRDDLEVG